MDVWVSLLFWPVTVVMNILKDQYKKCKGRDNANKQLHIKHIWNFPQFNFSVVRIHNFDKKKCRLIWVLYGPTWNKNVLQSRVSSKELMKDRRYSWGVKTSAWSIWDQFPVLLLPVTRVLSKITITIKITIRVLQDNLNLSTDFIMWMGHLKGIRKLTFRALLPFVGAHEGIVGCACGLYIQKDGATLLAGAC